MVKNAIILYSILLKFQQMDIVSAYLSLYVLTC